MGTSSVLIIDDDQGLLKALTEVLRLQMSGLTVKTSSSPHRALEDVTATDYDAIISDINMPGMSGLELLNEIRSRRPDTPILMMTSHDERDLVVYALRGGAFDFIQKPIDQAYFIASLNRAIQMRHLSRQMAEQEQRHKTELEQAVKEAVAQAEASQKRLAFLAEASTLLSSSLDYEATLARLARLAVLYLADYCTVDILEEDGSLRCVGLAHRDREQEIILRKARQSYQINPTSAPALYEAIEKKHSVLFTNIKDEMLAAGAKDAEHLELIKQVNNQSFITVPLVSGERVLGTITFTLTTSKRRYQREDVALAEDLTRRAMLAIENARLYNEAQEALAIRDQFLSIAAHELKTPMTSILGTSQLLLRRAEKEGNNDVRHLRSLQVLSTQTQRLNRLVESLLDLSRLEANQFVIERHPFDFTALINRVVEEMSMTLTTHKIECNCGTTPLIIEADELRLEQVLQNLLQNAVKYSTEGGTIKVDLKMNSANVFIDITDEGMGIAPDEIPHLFDRFYRVNNPDTRQISGMGLGLYIVKQIINLHSGTITVDSTEGKGSTFTITLPLS